MSAHGLRVDSATGTIVSTPSAAPGLAPTTEERVRCPTCLAVFRTGYLCCPFDGAPLDPQGDSVLSGVVLAERYLIEDMVGEGSMGLVYRARHAHIPRVFAIKVLFGDLVADPVMRLRFAQEAAAASKLSHPNVVSVVDFGKTEAGLLYLVMDYVEGEPLSHLIEREAPLPPRRAVALARELALGLGHAHAAGLVHRDFKPDNVVLERREDGGPPVPRILDFGLAISARDDDPGAARLTQLGCVVGTPIYLSPEQAREEPVNQRADLFALGVVIYEMLAGKPPFEGSPAVVAHRNMVEAVPPIAARNPAVSVAPELELVVRRLVEKRPERRFSSAEELVAALDRVDEILARRERGEVNEASASWSGADPVASTAALEPVWTAATGWRRGVTGVIALVALVLVVVVGGGLKPPGHRGRGEPVAGQGARSAQAGNVARAGVARAGSVARADRARGRPMGPSPSAGAAAARGGPGRGATDPAVATDLPAADSARPAPAPAPAPAHASSKPHHHHHHHHHHRTRTAAAAPPTQPGDGASSAEASVQKLIHDYHAVGEDLAHLGARRPAAEIASLQSRYLRIPFSRALRAPAVRREALARLGALRQEIHRALARASGRAPAEAVSSP